MVNAIMNVLYPFVILLYFLVHDVTSIAIEDEESKPKQKPRYSYVTRHRFKNVGKRAYQLGDDGTKDDRTIGYKWILTRDDQIDDSNNNIGLDATIAKDQRPKGLVSYRSRHRFFNAGKRDKENEVASYLVNDNAKRMYDSKKDVDLVDYGTDAVRVSKGVSSSRPADANERRMDDDRSSSNLNERMDGEDEGIQYDDVKYVMLPRDISNEMRNYETYRADAKKKLKGEIGQVTNDALDVLKKMDSYSRRTNRHLGYNRDETSGTLTKSAKSQGDHIGMIRRRNSNVYDETEKDVEGEFQG